MVFPSMCFTRRFPPGNRVLMDIPSSPRPYASGRPAASGSAIIRINEKRLFNVFLLSGDELENTFFQPLALTKVRGPTGQPFASSFYEGVLFFMTMA